LTFRKFRIIRSNLHLQLCQCCIIHTCLVLIMIQCMDWITHKLLSLLI